MDWIGFVERAYYLVHRRADLVGYLANEFSPSDPHHVLDFGGGTGRVSVALAASLPAAQFIVADPSADALARGPRSDRIRRVRIAAKPALPFTEAAFDAVFMVDVLHHVSHVPESLGECARALRPGGVLVAIEFDATAWPTRLFGRLVRMQGRSCSFWTPARLEGAFVSAGLETNATRLDQLRFAVQGRWPLR